MESANVARFQIDKTPPVVQFSGNLGTYTVDQTVVITCSASDALSGLASNTCQNINKPAYDNPLGDNVITATATDIAGNFTQATAQFQVTVTFDSLANLVRRFAPQFADALLATLNAAKNAEAQGNLTAKAAILAAFVNQVNGFATQGALTAWQRDLLVYLAGRL